VRLSVPFRAVLYLVIGVLFITGAAWVAVDRAVWPETSTYLLRLHGGAAMAMLVLLGALLPLHVRVGWRRRRNRASGALMVAANAILAATAFGLYYAGSDALRHWTSELHIALGFVLPLAVAGHVLRGRRGRRATREQHPAGFPQGW
jgi:cation transport ATPase